MERGLEKIAKGCGNVNDDHRIHEDVKRLATLVIRDIRTIRAALAQQAEPVVEPVTKERL
jgi:hypothetical protein